MISTGSSMGTQWMWTRPSLDYFPMYFGRYSNGFGPGLQVDDLNKDSNRKSIDWGQASYSMIWIRILIGNQWIRAGLQLSDFD